MAVHTPTITEPGVYEMTADEYHADPVVGGSLSSSGARALLPPSCPAKYRWAQDHPDEVPVRRVFNFGHAAHKLVLGAGPELHVVDADSYRTKAAQNERDEALAGGAVPLTRPEWAQVKAMAAALRDHPVVGKLFEPESGWSELALVWRDEHTGVMCRALLDRYRTGPRPVIVDYKGARAGDLESISRAIYEYGYHIQNAWYAEGARALGLAGDDTPFVFVFQEKDPPYLVTPVYLDPTALRIGAARCRQARSIYRYCTDQGHWYAHTDDLALVSLPPWAERAEGER